MRWVHQSARADDRDAHHALQVRAEQLSAPAKGAVAAAEQDQAFKELHSKAHVERRTVIERDSAARVWVAPWDRDAALTRLRRSKRLQTLQVCRLACTVLQRRAHATHT